MRPPSIISRIIRPAILIMKIKEIAIRTVCRYISSRCITFLSFIYSFSVHPLIKRSTMAEYSIQNNLHATFVQFFHKLCKHLITCLQIALICHTPDIFCGMCIISILRCKQSVTVFNDLSVMRIHIIVILTVVFVVTW